MEFKIGDKVLVKSGISHSSRKLAGKICTIETIDIGFCTLEEEEEIEDTSNTFKSGIWYNEIELYKEEFPEKWWIYPKSISEIEVVGKWFDENHTFSNTRTFYSTLKYKTGYTNAFQKENVYFEEKPEQATEITFDQFKKHILKESTIMKNLLETEFVIENCTLPQRLAIKAYCDEKKIKYFKEATLTTTNEPNLEFSNGKFIQNTTNPDGLKPITFSELIQFLDKYQPVPELKDGDIVVVLDTLNVREYNSRGIGHIFKIDGDRAYLECFLKGRKEALDPKNEYGINYQLGDLRHATPEEIKKWKEENETKLPKISIYSGEHSSTNLKWGCTVISIGTVKELLDLGLSNIDLGGYELNNEKIQQIKKFIEHNKL